MDTKKELRPYVKEWVSREVAHPKGSKVDFHFHDVEEWLEVLSGSGLFYRVNETAVHIKKESILYIPQVRSIQPRWGTMAYSIRCISLGGD